MSQEWSIIRRARLCWDMIPRGKEGDLLPQPCTSISLVHHLPQTCGSSWEPEKCVSAADSHGLHGAPGKGTAGFAANEGQCKAASRVIYYLGRQGCDTRQITGPVGGQDTRKAGSGGWEDEGEEQGPRNTAAVSSSSVQQNLWGGFVTAGSWRAFSKAPVETLNHTDCTVNKGNLISPHKSCQLLNLFRQKSVYCCVVRSPE